MSDHPSTFHADPEHNGQVEWDDRASLHRADDGDGMLYGISALARGTFAEMIRRLALMPEEKRAQYLIEKAGDRKYTAAEAMELSRRADFPGE